MSQKNNKFVKGTLITFLAGAITVNYLKKLVFGSPPSKVRQYIVFGTLGGIFAYNKLGLDQYYQDFKDSINDSRLERIDNLESRVLEKRKEINGLKTLHKNERTRVLDLTARLNKEISNQRFNPKVPNDSDYWYVVREDDTVNSIANRIYGSNVQANNIITLNGLAQPNNLTRGKPLKIPEEGIINYRVLNEKNFPARYVKIRRGENLRHVLQRKAGDGSALFMREVKNYNIERGNYIDYRGILSTKARHDSKLYLPR